MPDIAVTVRQQEPPEDWVRLLRATSPKSESHSWLYLHWHGGVERWLLYECVPNAFIDEGWRAELEGPHPDSDPLALCSAFQWAMYRRFRVNARPCWVIQGTKGGHLYAYDESTKELAKAVNLPAEPPKAGTLPYAPFDQRVVRQILKLDKLKAAKNDLAEFRRTFTGEGHKRWVAERKKEARREMVRWLEDQLEEPLEHFKDASRAGELEHAPISETDWVKKDEEATAAFIETGSLHPVGSF